MNKIDEDSKLFIYSNDVEKAIKIISKNLEIKESLLRQRLMKRDIGNKMPIFTKIYKKMEQNYKLGEVDEEDSLSMAS